MATVPFKETRDHAKWCVTADRDVPMVCIGDINRQVNNIQVFVGSYSGCEINFISQCISQRE